MSDITLDPYLFFSGNCREAMEFYKSVFGGELSIQTFGDVPGTEAVNKDQIMHANLDGGAVKLFGSDSSKASERAAKIELTIGGSDEAKLTDIFNALSDGGTVKTPLKKEFWGDTFGQLTDKFGIDWMVNIAAPKAD
ncbi:MAG TPA: VOC family protein [Verrucomicrobiae bacterium]|nr:VOC family protein [Verrucomicrobiae bacterium]